MNTEKPFKPAAILLKQDDAGAQRVSSDHEDTERDLDRQLRRLVSLQGSDPGFYLLALHSFVENFLRNRYALYGSNESFGDLIYYYCEELKKKREGFIPLIKTLNEMARTHSLANQVRHSFMHLDSEEAVSATYRFVHFCRESFISCDDVVTQLELSMELWKERSNRWEEMQELQKANNVILRERRQNDKLSAELEELQALSKKYETVQKEKLQLELDMEELKIHKEERRDKIHSLRARRFEIEKEKRGLSAKISELEVNNSYLLNLTRLSAYTRSRLDYERAVTRLTKEQENILDEMSFGSDFLIKGNAGTGKTLVLIKAVEKAREISSRELNFGRPAGSTMLLTYTRTLVKYDRYLAEIMKSGEAESSIQTADKFIRDVLVSQDGRSLIDYGFVEEYVRQHNTTKVMSNKELAEEIEDYIYANNITEEEYLVQLKPREGMGRPLTKVHREAVWVVLRNLQTKMEEDRRYSKNYSRIKLLQMFDEDPSLIESNSYDFIFVDEVQDLTAADLSLIKRLSSRAVIMAGDADQAIYQAGFTFIRAGIDIAGKSRILRTNFRNTVQIHEAAERFRMLGRSTAEETRKTPEAFRTGPPPECFTADQTTKLLALLRNQVNFFLDTLGYDPENICVLAPSSKWIEEISETLNGEKFGSYDLRKEDFSFYRTDVIRLSTLHSSKGLDFPVVLLFLPELPFTGFRHDVASKTKILNNLVYVGMTRAMDHLNVFLLNDRDGAILRDFDKIITPVTDFLSIG
jgi:hypothetical protein